jgi:radical SAM superfamily enzyme YgiQ (UPF0313 family)
MRYEEPVYRPPSEANSILIQATIGCPHNKCTFCGMYKGKKFRIRKVADIKKDILTARQFYNDDIESIFFPDGNTIIMKTAELEEIFRFCYEVFPGLRRLTLYASAKFLKFKTQEDLRRLRQSGLKRIHKGLESGNDEVLRRIQKGADSKLMIETAKRVKDAGIELSEYVLVGIAGKDLSKEHSIDTAKVLNEIDPDYIRLRTWVPVPNAPLYKDYEKGEFQLLTPHQALQETKTLLENLKVTGLFLSDHISNFVNISGQLPRDKKSMLSKIDEALKFDENCFRPAIIENL